jgi:hypothetical protein
MVNTYNKGSKTLIRKTQNSHAATGRRNGNPFITKAYNESTKGVATADAEKRMATFIQRIDKFIKYVKKYPKN